MSIFALAFLGSYGFLLVKCFTSRPFFGLCAYLMAFYLNPPARWWSEYLPDLRWSFMAAALTLISIMIRDKSVIRSFKFIETKVFTVFVVYVIFQSLWAVSKPVHMEWVSMSFNFLVLMVMIQGSIRDERDLLGFVFVNLIGCSYFGYLGMVRTSGGRLDGIGGPSISSSNQMSQHLAAMMFIGIYLVFVNFKKHIWYLLVAVLLFVVLKTIVMAGSRGTFLAIAATGFVGLLFVPRKDRFRMYVLAGICSLIAASLVGPYMIERFEGMGKNESGEISDESARSRIYIIEAQIEMVKAAPFLGHGHKGTLLLSPIYVPPEYRTAVADREETVRASHNFLFSLLVDHGIVGASLYIFIILRCLFRLPAVVRMKIKTEEAHTLQVVLIGLIMGLLCLMVAGMTSDHKNAETGIWFYALIPLCFSWLKEKNNVA